MRLGFLLHLFVCSRKGHVRPATTVRPLLPEDPIPYDRTFSCGRCGTPLDPADYWWPK